MSSQEIMASTAMCAYCFDVLNAHFERGDASHLLLDATRSLSVGGMFVTLNKLHGRGKQLRGCIGRLSPLPLNDLSKYVLLSAFNDSRFPPLSREELPHIEIAISLLVNYESARNYLDWEVGTHGIIIEFEVNSKQYSGTYLPDVSAEQGWSREEAVHSLIRKAGYRGKIDSGLLESLSVTRYQSSKTSLSHKEHQEFKKNEV